MRVVEYYRIIGVYDHAGMIRSHDIFLLSAVEKKTRSPGALSLTFSESAELKLSSFFLFFYFDTPRKTGYIIVVKKINYPLRDQRYGSGIEPEPNRGSFPWELAEEKME